MRPSTLLSAGAFALAAMAAFGTATLAARGIEDRSAREVSLALRTQGLEFAQVTTDGLILTLSGTAATEAERFRAVSVAGGRVDPARVVDAMAVADAARIPAPRFALEVLRTDGEVGLIGLIPATTDRAALATRIARATGAEVSDLLQTATVDPPEGWDAALDWTVDALADLPHAQLSVGARRIEVTAAAPSAQEAARLERALRADAPRGAEIVTDITAPRPVISPFTLRFRAGPEGTRFDACAADTAAAAETILAAARAAGAEAEACPVGLGTPSPRWAEAAAAGIAAVAEMGAGTLTISDTAVSLIGAEGVGPSRFDDVAGALETALPPAFALRATPPPAPGGVAEAATFVATRSPEGLVLLRGRLPDERTRAAVAAIAEARFGGDAVRLAARTADGLPRDWSARVIAGIDALALLETGALRVEAGTLGLRGRTGRREGPAEIAALLAGALGEDAAFTVDVAYDEALDPLAALPSPEECVAEVEGALEGRKISFDPGSADLVADARVTMDNVARILRGCPAMRLEVQAHSDSQGRESMNLALSQSRAEAVVAALIERRVLDQTLIPRGYGEARPIADNATPEGREANRRIEFALAGGGADAAENASEADAETDAEGDAPAEEPAE